MAPIRCLSLMLACLLVCARGAPAADTTAEQAMAILKKGHYSVIPSCADGE
jgi:hypothetical protein